MTEKQAWTAIAESFERASIEGPTPLSCSGLCRAVENVRVPERVRNVMYDKIQKDRRSATRLFWYPTFNQYVFCVRTSSIGEAMRGAAKRARFARKQATLCD